MPPATFGVVEAEMEEGQQGSLPGISVIPVSHARPDKQDRPGFRDKLFFVDRNVCGTLDNPKEFEVKQEPGTEGRTRWIGGDPGTTQEKLVHDGGVHVVNNAKVFASPGYCQAGVRGSMLRGVA